MRFRGFSLCVLSLAAVSQGFASTIVSVTGEQSGIESGSSAEWTGQAWTQGDTYTDVTIRATLIRAILGNPFGNGSAFLEKKEGNRAVEIASLNFRFPKNQRQLTLFDNLALGPGTYFLALYGEGFWIADLIPVVSGAPDVTNITDTLVSFDNGRTFQDTNNGLFQDYIVTGTREIVNSTPEPATWTFVGVVLLLGGLWRPRRFLFRGPALH